MDRLMFFRGVLLACLLMPFAACTTLPPPGALPASFSRALERVMPSIVGVYGIDPMSERFADLSVADGTVGAGFFIDAQGTIVTAAHVTSDYAAVVVRLADQRIFLAERVAEDKELDISIIRIPLPNSRPAAFGKSAGLRPGDWVLAVGEPFGLRRSVLAGVVGGSLRHFGEDAEGMFIQTNMALNPGNSGGPLLDLSGAVVGMNVRTVNGSMGTGVSLSVPIDLILQVADELQAGGGRPRFGAHFEDVSVPVAYVARLPSTRGAAISEIIKGGAAERAGLRVGDLLVAIDDTEIADSADLSRRLFAWRGGATVTFTAVRDGTAHQIRVGPR